MSTHAALILAWRDSKRAYPNATNALNIPKDMEAKHGARSQDSYSV